MAYTHDPDDITVVATSNSSPYVISGSSFWGAVNDYWHAFNHLGGASSWVTASGQITNQYITLDFGSGNSYAFNRVTVTSSTYDATSAPKNMIVKGSNNGADWTDVYTVPQQTGWSLDETRSFSFTNATSYRYFQLFITDYNGYSTYGSVGEIEIFAGATYNETIVLPATASFTVSSTHVANASVPVSGTAGFGTEGGLVLDSAIILNVTADMMAAGGSVFNEVITLNSTAALDFFNTTYFVAGAAFAATAGFSTGGALLWVQIQNPSTGIWATIEIPSSVGWS